MSLAQGRGRASCFDRLTGTRWKHDSFGLAKKQDGDTERRLERWQGHKGFEHLLEF